MCSCQVSAMWQAWGRWSPSKRSGEKSSTSCQSDQWLIVSWWRRCQRTWDMFVCLFTCVSRRPPDSPSLLSRETRRLVWSESLTVWLHSSQSSARRIINIKHTLVCIKHCCTYCVYLYCDSVQETRCDRSRSVWTASRVQQILQLVLPSLQQSRPVQGTDSTRPWRCWSGHWVCAVIWR